MQLREIREYELADLLRLYEDLHESDFPLPDQSVVERTWESIVRSDQHCYPGAYVDGNLVGTCALVVIPNLTRGCKPYGVIENVVTASGFRRKGIGTALLQYALKQAWQRECYKVMLLTGRMNEETYRFYEAAGFDRHSKQAFLAKPQ